MGAEAANAVTASVADAPRYRAFISYSHRDAVFVARLHRALEGYRLPARLRRGGLPARLVPIFRDVDELRADGDLSAQVKQALADSAALILVASPNAKASPWVAREIALFREAFPDRPILVALADGEPDDAFPPALLTGANGPVEPLAADFRKGGDGERLARLKLVAALADVPLDDLVQRDAARRLRAVMAVTAGAGALVLILAALLVVALRARAEAERQREDAEGMVEFMLTDLRDKLRAVGRIDAMTAVNERAMRRYASQDIADLDADTLDRRSRLISAMGEDQEAVGNVDGAEALYREAWRTSAALLAKAPDSPDRIFAHARAENRLALTAYGRGHYGEAIKGFERADALLHRLPESDNEPWLRLRAMVSGNLCGNALRLRRADKARLDKQHLDECRVAVAMSRRLAAADPAKPEPQYDLGFHLLWLGEAYDAEGKPEDADAARDAALATSNALCARDRRNMDWREQNMQIKVTLAERSLAKGDRARTRAMVASARADLRQLLNVDATNANWNSSLKRLAKLEREMQND